MVCVAAGTGLIATGGSIVAFLGGSVFEIMLGRFFVQMVLAFTWWFVKTPPGKQHWYGDEGTRLNIWIRGTLYFLLVYGWYRGLELVPIGDAEAIIFIAPLLIVIIARFVLKEPLSKVFPATFVLTVAGIVFVCQPPFLFSKDSSHRSVSVVGLVFLFVMAISWALSSILVRTAKKAHWLQIQTVASVQGFCIWTPALMLLNRLELHSEVVSGGEWSALSAKNVGLIVLCAVMAFAGMSLNVVGYQIGDATKVAWMEYCDLIFAFLFQWAVFSEEPGMWEWIGLACLLMTCVLHLAEEAVVLVRFRRRMKNAEQGEREYECIDSGL